MEFRKIAVFATLAFGAACAAEQPADETDVAPHEAELAPLPAPKSMDLEAPGSICDHTDPAQLALLETKVRFLIDESLGQHAVTHDSSLRIIDYVGRVEELESPVPEQIADMLHSETPEKELRSAVLNVGGRTQRLLSKTRSIGLRVGMNFEARETYRPGTGFLSAESKHRIIIRSEDETVFYHEEGELLAELDLPDELEIERADLLCSEVIYHGDLWSLRIRDHRGRSIVLQPNQAGSLGDYDIYLWLALYPAGMNGGLGLDAPNALTKLTIVRRAFHTP